jgi:hypothetical protein
MCWYTPVVCVWRQTWSYGTIFGAYIARGNAVSALASTGF